MPLDWDKINARKPEKPAVTDEKPSKFVTVSKLPNKEYVGKFLRLGTWHETEYQGKKKTVLSAYFATDWNGQEIEQEWNMSETLATQFEFSGVDEGQYVRIRMVEKDKVNRDTGELVPGEKEFDRWEVEVLGGKPKMEVHNPENINLDDIPF